MRQQNEAFQNQIQELVIDKQQRESQIDEFSLALDTKVEDLKVEEIFVLCNIFQYVVMFLELAGR